jgi:ABC-type branched-subunit amino acid transport system ATPase component
VVALAGIDIEVPLGRVTGLIGPNGAGKTTFFNACSGLIKLNDGTIRLDGRDLTHKGPGARARAGLGRTFQDMRLFDSLTVRENVALGREGSYAGLNPLSHLGGGGSATRAVRQAADEAIQLCGLEAIADRPVHGLSTGQRRLVDLARCVAGDHKVLLLDEPSSGLDVAETLELGSIVKRIIEERGVAVLLVEHDLPLVLDLSAFIYVLDFGELIFSGTRDEVQASPAVQAAYLGDAAVEEMIEHDHEPDSATPAGTR